MTLPLACKIPFAILAVKSVAALPIPICEHAIIAVLSWSIVYPGLTAIAEKANVGGTLGLPLG